MKTFHAKRLVKLANFLRELPKRKFCFADIINGRPNECGTKACALGWAGLMPEFNKAGFKTFIDEGEGEDEDGYDDGNIKYKDKTGRTHCGLIAADMFFGLTDSETDGLFIPDNQFNIDKPSLDENATPKAVAKNIICVVKEKGFVVNKSPDGSYELAC